MATRVFALIIGIDDYKSGNIWNLETCLDDALSVKRWLTHDLHVPREQIRLLLDKQATQCAIEDAIMNHLVNNPAIEHGDAIVVYFAGHGSTMRAPRGWYGEISHYKKDVEVLCPYDHDTKRSGGRVAGISDRSVHAMMADLSAAKGNNITLILDCCFSPPTSRVALRERRHTRWTPTTKASPDDLERDLWRSALGLSGAKPGRGFARESYDTHIVLAACRAGESAIEGKGGGLFTRAILAVKDTEALHRMRYATFAHEIGNLLEDAQQHPALCGKHKDRILFNGLPFMPDVHFVSIDAYDKDNIRVEAGGIHGVIDGTEFSIHRHNCRGSVNPSLGTFSAIEVHPTWCLARSKSRGTSFIQEGWARITRWNNRTPFRVHIRRSLFSLCRRFRLRRQIPSKQGKEDQNRPGVSMVRVKTASQADVSVTLRRREMVVERHDNLIAANCRRIIQLTSEQTSTDLKILDAAAHFHLHLHRKNPQRPLLGLVTMELYRLDSSTWTRTSGNLLVDGRAQIVDDEKNSIYSVVLQNYSNVDLWPYLAYMDASGYGITMVYHPDSASSKPPLRKHDSMVIGSGKIDSEALSFSLADGADTGAGFLKLFISSAFTPMTSIEQGPPSISIVNPPTRQSKSNQKSSISELWDSVVACVTVVRKW